MHTLNQDEHKEQERNNAPEILAKGFIIDDHVCTTTENTKN